jgi:hypothetical protein
MGVFPSEHFTAEIWYTGVYINISGESIFLIQRDTLKLVGPVAMIKKGTLTRHIRAYGWPIKNQQDCLYKQMHRYNTITQTKNKNQTKTDELNVSTTSTAYQNISRF